MTMREKMARALAADYDRQAREDGRIGGALTAYNAGVGMTINFWNGMADVALDALREPTEGMDEAAKPFRKGVGEKAGRLWAAMIDAAKAGA